MRGKYSPTVSEAYARDQEWWHRYSREAEEFTQYDPEGYDAYGYDKDDVDRAGNAEWEYYESDEYGENARYNAAWMSWGFDGEKPVPR